MKFYLKAVLALATLAAQGESFAGQCSGMGSAPWNRTVGVWGSAFNRFSARDNAISRRDNELAACNQICSQAGGIFSAELNIIYDEDCFGSGSSSTCFASAFVSCSQDNTPIPPPSDEALAIYKKLEEFYDNGSLPTQAELQAITKPLKGFSRIKLAPDQVSAIQFVFYTYGDDITVPKKFYEKSFSAAVAIDVINPFMVNLIQDGLLSPMDYSTSEKSVVVKEKSGEADWPPYGMQIVCGGTSKVRKYKTEDGKTLLISKSKTLDSRSQCQAVVNGQDNSESIAYTVLE